MLTQFQIDNIRKESGLPPVINGNVQKSLAERIGAKPVEAPITDTQPIDNNEIGAAKILDVTGGKKIAEGLGQGLAQKKNAKLMQESLDQAISTQTQILKLIKEKRDAGEDTSHLHDALNMVSDTIKNIGNGTSEVLNPNHLTPEAVLGDALQLATTAAAGGVAKAGAGLKAGQLGKAAVEADKTVGIVKGVVKGAKTGAKSGAIFGAGQGAADAMKEDANASDVISGALKGGALGAAGGGVLGGLIGGVGGGINAKNARESIIKAQEANGIRPTLDATIAEKSATNPEFGALVQEAKKQGYSESDINFLSSVSPADKPVLQKMFEATTAAQSNPRQITRAADILGENATNIVKEVQTQNKTAGKAVDATAKALKGQFVDATPVREKAMSLLQDAGVTANKNGTANWSKSIFNKTPELQTKLKRALSDLPSGSIDAYQLHNFKKSIDEVVEYGVGGEGLKGKSANILKQIRTEADNVLDSKFEDYNAANTEFKKTRDFIDQVKETVGKNVDFSSKQGAQSFGQSFRSAFSNNKSRPQTLKLIEDLQMIAKERGLTGSDQNLLDQALYVNMLEDQFGSAATTGLANEVTKGIKKAKGLAEAVRSPIKSALNATAEAIQKGQNITPEMKKDVLNRFIRDGAETPKASFGKLIDELKTNGGGTINLDGTPKELGTDHIVSVRSKNLPIGDVTDADIQKFKDENSDLIKEFGDKIKIGLFKLDDNTASIDLNIATDAKKSMKLAKLGKQQSVFDEKAALDTNFGDAAFRQTGHDGKNPVQLTIDQIKKIIAAK